MDGIKILKEKEILPAKESAHNTPDKAPSPERSIEQPKPTVEQSMDEGGSSAEVANPSSSIAPIDSVIEAELEIRREKIEQVMSAGLTEAYTNMDPTSRNKFKLAGEQTAREINRLLSESRVRVSTIINLIKNWLKLIPGVNKFFLEQEAKIKTDAILQLKKGGEQ